MKFEAHVWGEIALALADQAMTVRVSHKGRVRRSELEQALRTGRDREPFGVFWEKRHLRQAVTLAILRAQSGSPASLAFLDMNGMKPINDQHGHDAGDVAIKTYLQAIDMLKGENADGFRVGGDEVVVVMQGASADQARDRMRAVLLQLGKERVLVNGNEVAPFLTASCGIVSTEERTIDAEALVKRADDEMYRAKAKSKSGTRQSVLAVEGRDPEYVS
jgi:diguanylate cyclase (GGDEF)-like protein